MSLCHTYWEWDILILHRKVISVILPGSTVSIILPRSESSSYGLGEQCPSSCLGGPTAPFCTEVSSQTSCVEYGHDHPARNCRLFIPPGGTVPLTDQTCLAVLVCYTSGSTMYITLPQKAVSIVLQGRNFSRISLGVHFPHPAWKSSPLPLYWDNHLCHRAWNANTITFTGSMISLVLPWNTVFLILPGSPISLILPCRVFSVILSGSAIVVIMPGSTFFVILLGATYLSSYCVHGLPDHPERTIFFILLCT